MWHRAVKVRGVQARRYAISEYFASLSCLPLACTFSILYVHGTHYFCTVRRPSIEGARGGGGARNFKNINQTALYFTRRHSSASQPARQAHLDYAFPIVPSVESNKLFGEQIPPNKPKRGSKTLVVRNKKKSKMQRHLGKLLAQYHADQETLRRLAPAKVQFVRVGLFRFVG